MQEQTKYRIANGVASVAATGTPMAIWGNKGAMGSVVVGVILIVLNLLYWGASKFGRYGE